MTILLEPLIVGRAVRLHAVAVLLAVAADGLTAGIGGAVVAVPLLAFAYQATVGSRTDRLRPAQSFPTSLASPAARLRRSARPCAGTVRMAVTDRDRWP